jgi:hypothetical protein
MDELRSRLLEAAVSKFGEISPTSARSSLQECFTEEDSRVILWFNDRRGNTRAMIQKKKG